MRQWINDNAALAAVALVVIVALGVWVMRPSSASGFEQVYFWDIATGELVVMPSDTLSPATSGNGLAVQAVVMACGSCDDESNHFVARLEMYTEEARQLVQQMAANRPANEDEARRIEQQIAAGRMVAEKPSSGGEPQWVSMMNPAGAMLLSTPAGKCGGAAVETCTPGK